MREPRPSVVILAGPNGALAMVAAGNHDRVAEPVVLTCAMRSMLVGVGPTDPVTYVSMGLVFFVIAAVALYPPARRPAALAPTAALRES